MKKNFNLKLFKRLLGFTKPYKLNFIFVSFSAIIISIFSILNQYFLKIAVDEYITPKDYNGLLYLIVIMILILCFQVTFQFLFIYFTNLLGQKVVYDLRTKLFKTIIQFKMLVLVYNMGSYGIFTHIFTIFSELKNLFLAKKVMPHLK